MTSVHRLPLWTALALLPAGCDTLWIDDDELCLTPRAYHMDADHDGYGVAGDVIWDCAPEGDHQATETRYFDCDDADPAWNIRCRWEDVQTEYTRTCARDTRGAITCWGDPTIGDLQPPEGAGPFTRFSVGAYAACALDGEGHITCWGGENSGDAVMEDVRVVGDAPTDAGYDAVAVGYNHACALRSGELRCWGYPPLYDLMPTEGPFTAIEANQFGSAAVREDRSVEYWGATQLSDLDPSWTPTQSTSEGPADQVRLGPLMSCERAGATTSCAFSGDGTKDGIETPGEDLAAGGSHYCAAQGGGDWNCRHYGFGGIGWKKWSAPAGSLATLSSGYDHDCGLRIDGTIACAGDANFPAAVWVPQSFSALAAGRTYTLGVVDGTEIATWGEVEADWYARDLVQIDARLNILCGLTGDGDVYCWGGTEALSAEGPFVGVAVAAHGFCAWDASGRVECQGHSDGVVGWYDCSETFAAAAVGADMACGARDEGGVRCWNYFDQGDETFTQGDGSDQAFAQLSVGWDARCGVRADHTAACWQRWGSTSYAEPGPDARLLSVAAGRYHACGIVEDGLSATDGPVECWAFTDDAPSSAAIPSPTERFKAVSAAQAYACALHVDGTPVCWGDTIVSTTTPTTQTFDQIATGASFACGLKVGESPVCWGNPPYLGVRNPIALAAGPTHACATGDQGTACFGEDGDGQATPPDRGPYTSLAAGAAHTCGLDGNQRVECWGDDTYGQASPPLGKRTTLAAGARHTCALDDEGSVSCWGDDSDGQVSVPEELEGEAFVALSAGATHTCALTAEGEAHCWGTGVDGEPFEAAEGLYTSIVSGGWHACGLLTDGTASCWGLDSFGQVSDVPAWTFAALTAGEETTCGLKPDGLSVCWGRDLEGQAEPPLPWEL